MRGRTKLTRTSSLGNASISRLQTIAWTAKSPTVTGLRSFFPRVPSSILVLSEAATLRQASAASATAKRAVSISFSVAILKVEHADPPPRSCGLPWAKGSLGAQGPGARKAEAEPAEARTRKSAEAKTHKLDDRHPTFISEPGSTETMSRPQHRVLRFFCPFRVAGVMPTKC